MSVDRRVFLKFSAKTLFLLGGVSSLQGCSPFVRENTFTTPDMSSFDKLLSNEQIKILNFASLAPSGHNSQPWVVRIKKQDHWIIGSEKNRWLPAVDPDNREMLLSIGAFLENLVLAAQHFGYEIEYKVIAKSAFDPEILEIVFHKTRAQEAELSLITARRTIRKNHQSKEIKLSDINFITKGVANFQYSPPDTVIAKYLAEGTIAANQVQAYRDSAQKELSEWIRWSKDSAKKHMNGLTPASMEINGVSGWYVSHFYNADSALANDFRQKTVSMVKKQVSQCGGWITLSSDDSSIASLIETGRQFEKIFLHVRKRNIALHPMTQMLEEAPWKNELAKELGENTQFILRVGYLEQYPEPTSLRMPLSQFVQKI